MKVVAAVVTFCLFASVSAFVPTTQNARIHSVSSALEAERGAKRKLVLKTVRRVAGALGTIALSTAAVPGLASARKAKKVVEVTKATPAISSDVVKTVGTVVAGIFVALMLKIVVGSVAATECTTKIESVFPGALTNKKLVSRVSSALDKYKYGRDTLLATSLSGDSVSRALEKDFAVIYDDNYSMGGLAGFPFGGVTSFGAMAAHIPDDGSCLIVFGPNVGVDSTGAVGTVELRGRADVVPCCVSAIAAFEYVADVKSGKSKKPEIPKEPTDAQQNFVVNMLLPYSTRLEKANDAMVELPYVLYDAQKKLMGDIVKAACGNVPGDGKIAVLGGIQINTAEGTSDYFKPMSFEVYDNTGKLLEDMTSKL